MRYRPGRVAKMVEHSQKEIKLWRRSRVLWYMHIVPTLRMLGGV
jgi:hypothetical protein